MWRRTVEVVKVGGFLRVHPVSSTNKTDCHDITVTLLQVALNTITSNPNLCNWWLSSVNFVKICDNNGRELFSSPLQLSSST
jgi:hypothetical protein